jgi:glycosyltransferase involved in cell wall biosynthesis
MRVSVVIPTYNSAPLVVEAVSSVLAQTKPAAEVIVVDDGSTDDTSDRLAQFGSSLRYIHKENGGVSSARNCGIAAATGDLIAFLDADDVWHPRKLEFQQAALARRPELGLLGTGFYTWPGIVPDVPSTLVEDYKEILLDELIVGNCLGTSSIMVRADILRTAGSFDLTLQGPEDRDMWIRLARLTPVAILRMPLSGYRFTPGSLSKNAARMELGERAILRKLEREGAFRGKFLLRQKAWGIFHYSCGRERLKAGNRWGAALYLALSFLSYPLPYRQKQLRNRFERIRMLGSAILKPVRKPTGAL